MLQNTILCNVLEMSAAGWVPAVLGPERRLVAQARLQGGHVLGHKIV